MTLYDIVKKIIGPIEPIGMSEVDEKNYLNLEETIDLVDKLLFDLNIVASHKDSYEHSVSKAGKLANNFLREIYNDADEQ